MPCQLVLGISALAAVHKSLSWAVTSPVLSGSGGEGPPKAARRPAQRSCTFQTWKLNSLLHLQSQVRSSVF